MNEKIVKRIFIFFLCYLPLQYAVVGIVGYYKSEPWPAFVFPGFKNIYVYENGFEIDNPLFEIVSEDSVNSIRMRPGDFFPEISTSKISGFMRTHFRDVKNIEAFDRETKLWLIDHADEFTDNQIVAVHIVWERNFFPAVSDQAKPDSIAELQRYPLLRGDI